MMTYDEVRQRHIEDLLTRFGPHLQALQASGDELAALRQERLRGLVAHAVGHSPFHRERLRGIDPATITEADVASLPTMSKTDLMSSFDDIVTDDRLTRDVVERHLASLEAGPAYLFDEYHVVATGGSSGSRTIVVWDWDGWIDCFVSLCRYGLARDAGNLGAGPIAGIAADHPSHMSAAAQTTFSNPMIDMHKIPASLPMEEIVARLNEVQPETVLGYASMIHRLALEASAGRLRIAPRKVLSSSESLLPETRTLVEEVWGIVVDNAYAASETAGVAGSCGRGPWLHLNDDLHIIEIEDDRVLVTNLVNRVMPLIRYELDDRTRLLDIECPCGSAHRVIADPEGRTGDGFTFSGGRVVHPIVFSSTIGKRADVVEYQVRQRGDAVAVDVLPNGELDVCGLRSAIETALEGAGASGVKVEVATVAELERHGATSKLRRFVPDASGR
jgi:phenylacetate-CoA ligase